MHYLEKAVRNRLKHCQRHLEVKCLTLGSEWYLLISYHRHLVSHLHAQWWTGLDSVYVYEISTCLIKPFLNLESWTNLYLKSVLIAIGRPLQKVFYEEHFLTNESCNLCPINYKDIAMTWKISYDLTIFHSTIVTRPTSLLWIIP